MKRYRIACSDIVKTKKIYMKLKIKNRMKYKKENLSYIVPKALRSKEEF